MLTNEDKMEVAELLALIFHDNEFVSQYEKINEETVKETEALILKLRACNNAIAALLATVKCIPKSTNVHGWLKACVPAVFEAYRRYNNDMYNNMLCSIGIQGHHSEIKLTMIMPHY